jgi:UDP-N-acetylglucosamine transferase subunit ALG13
LPARVGNSRTKRDCQSAQIAAGKNRLMEQIKKREQDPMEGLQVIHYKKLTDIHKNKYIE